MRASSPRLPPRMVSGRRIHDDGRSRRGAGARASRERRWLHYRWRSRGLFFTWDFTPARRVAQTEEMGRVLHRIPGPPSPALMWHKFNLAIIRASTGACQAFPYGSGIVLLGPDTLVICRCPSSQEYPENHRAKPSCSGVSTQSLSHVHPGFILFGRDQAVHRKQGRTEGSRIESKLYFGALALTSCRSASWCFHVHLLNSQVEKWFSRPATRCAELSENRRDPGQSTARKAQIYAAALAERPESSTASAASAA